MAHQPYPKWRYHQDGRSFVVKDPVDEAARAPDSAGFGDLPFRDDGPTLEDYVKAGFQPDGYPPAGYLAKTSPAFTALIMQRALARSSSAPPQPSAPPAPVEPSTVPDPPELAGDVAALNGTVEDVTKLVGAILSKETLEQLKAAETAGKNRKGVLTAIDAQLAK